MNKHLERTDPSVSPARLKEAEPPYRVVKFSLGKPVKTSIRYFDTEEQAVAYAEEFATGYEQAYMVREDELGVVVWVKQLQYI